MPFGENSLIRPFYGMTRGNELPKFLELPQFNPVFAMGFDPRLGSIRGLVEETAYSDDWGTDVDGVTDSGGVNIFANQDGVVSRDDCLRIDYLGTSGMDFKIGYSLQPYVKYEISFEYLYPDTNEVMLNDASINPGVYVNNVRHELEVSTILPGSWATKTFTVTAYSPDIEFKLETDLVDEAYLDERLYLRNFSVKEIVLNPCIRAFRSDGAIRSFPQSGLKAALEAWVAPSYSATAWAYDLTANGNDAVQAVVANQPTIATAGAVNVDALGNLALEFDGTDDYLELTPVSLGADDNSWAFSVVFENAGQTNRPLLEISDSTNFPRLTICIGEGGIANQIIVRTDGGHAVFSGVPAGVNLITLVAQAAGNVGVFLNGESAVEHSNVAYAYSPSDRLYVGRGRLNFVLNTAYAYYSGNISGVFGHAAEVNASGYNPAAGKIYPVNIGTPTETSEKTMRRVELEVLKVARENEYEIPAAQQATLKSNVETASGGRNTVLYSAEGVPGIYVRIDRDNTDIAALETELGLSGGLPHEAFVVDGVTKDAIWIGKYAGNIINVSTGAVVVNDSSSSNADYRVASLPEMDATHTVNFDLCLSTCRNNGTGFHLASNAEWAYIYLLTHRHGWGSVATEIPRGSNNDQGRDTSRSDELCVFAHTNSGGSKRCLLGTGPVSWTHDNTPYGIWDLNGNVWEWCSGLRWNGGEIQVMPGNDAALAATDHGSSSTNWRAILAADGSLVAPATSGTLKVDASNADGSGNIILSDTLVNQAATGTPSMQTQFSALTTALATVPAVAKRLGLYPLDAPNRPARGRHYARNFAEYLPLRGGYWINGSNAGVAYLNGNNPRGARVSNVGFRPAFVS